MKSKNITLKINPPPYENLPLCDNCGKVCADFALRQSKTARLWEFDGETIHLECYIRHVVDKHLATRKDKL